MVIEIGTQMNVQGAGIDQAGVFEIIQQVVGKFGIEAVEPMSQAPQHKEGGWHAGNADCVPRLDQRHKIRGADVVHARGHAFDAGLKDPRHVGFMDKLEHGIIIDRRGRPGVEQVAADGIVAAGTDDIAGPQNDRLKVVLVFPHPGGGQLVHFDHIPQFRIGDARAEEGGFIQKGRIIWQGAINVKRGQDHDFFDVVFEAELQNAVCADDVQIQALGQAQGRANIGVADAS